MCNATLNGANNPTCHLLGVDPAEYIARTNAGESSMGSCVGGGVGYTCEKRGPRLEVDSHPTGDVLRHMDGCCPTARRFLDPVFAPCNPQSLPSWGCGV